MKNASWGIFDKNLALFIIYICTYTSKNIIAPDKATLFQPKRNVVFLISSQKHVGMLLKRLGEFSWIHKKNIMLLTLPEAMNRHKFI